LRAWLAVSGEVLFGNALGAVSFAAGGQFPTIGIALAGNSFDRNIRTPYIQQYNLGVQYALGKDLLLETSYVETIWDSLSQQRRFVRLFR